MMEIFSGLTQLHNLFYSVLWFVVILTVLVFVHEFGHYIIARWNRVRVEVFSIGFGPELFGWWDRAGTRWKFSAIPLGGYVKMFGDSDAASTPSAGLPMMTEAQKLYQSLGFIEIPPYRFNPIAGSKFMEAQL